MNPLIDILDYSDMKKEFEKDHFVADNRYFKETNDVFQIITDFYDSYRHLLCFDDNGDIKTFIEMWIKDRNKRQYERIGSYPNLETCPPNTYNTWTPFHFETYEVYNDKPDEVKELLDFIKILIGNDKLDLLAFYDLVEHMIFCEYDPHDGYITLVGEEGCGKATLIHLLSNLLGSEKVLNTCDTDQDVLGQYNYKMNKKILIALYNPSKEEFKKVHDIIFNTITNHTITINQKTMTYDVFCNPRFIITADTINNVYVDKKTGFNCIIKCSNKLVGNRDYFRRIRKLINDTDVMKSLYEYFKNTSDLHKH